MFVHYAWHFPYALILPSAAAFTLSGSFEPIKEAS